MPSQRSRGRPRTFEPEHALEAALQTFRRRGFSGTSLSDLTDATGLNRPSLYAAFGNKQALFEAAVDHYWAYVAARCLPALDATGDLATDLRGFLARFIDVFADDEPGGCVVACGLPAEVERVPGLREKLNRMLAAADRASADADAARQETRAVDFSAVPGPAPTPRLRRGWFAGRDLAVLRAPRTIRVAAAASICPRDGCP